MADYYKIPLNWVLKNRTVALIVLKWVDEFNLEVILSSSDFRKAFFNFLPKKTFMEYNTIFRDHCLLTVDEVFHMVFIIVFYMSVIVLKSHDKSALLMSAAIGLKNGKLV